MARIMTQMVDAYMYDAGVPMNEIFYPLGATTAGGGPTGRIGQALHAYGKMMTAICKAVGATTVTYDPSCMAELNNDYWSTVIGNTSSLLGGAIPLSVGWARVPKHIITKFSDTWLPPQDNMVEKLGELEITQGFGVSPFGSFSVVQRQVPKMLDAGVYGWMVHAGRACVFPVARDLFAIGLSNKAGGMSALLGFCATTPSYGVNVANTLANFGATSVTLYNAVDPPLYGTFPRSTFYRAQQYRPFFYGGDFGSIDRAKQKLYTIHVIKVSNSQSADILNGDEDKDTTIDALAEMASSFLGG